MQISPKVGRCYKNRTPGNIANHKKRANQNQMSVPIKILIVVPGTGGKESGVEYHRLLIPYQYLNGKGFDVSLTNAIEGIPEDKLQDFPIIVCSRIIANPASGQTHKEVYDRCKKAGCTIILDVDDYWHLGPQHLLYHTYQSSGMTRQLMECIELADDVHTTTDILADQVKLINPLVTVLPNAIDPEQEQWSISETTRETPVIGWSGGICHLEDIQLLSDGFGRLNKDSNMKGAYKLALCGYDPTDKTGTWNQFVKIFAKNIRENILTRIQATDCYTYGSAYNEFDIAVIPLRPTQFNVCKSELKMIEAGFMKKAVIVSHTMPYKTLTKPGHNSLAVSTEAGWYYSMKKMISNPDMREDMAEQLYEDVQQYHIAKVSETRRQFYENIING